MTVGVFEMTVGVFEMAVLVPVIPKEVRRGICFN
jgi:hypothetical protein